MHRRLGVILATLALLAGASSAFAVQPPSTDGAAAQRAVLDTSSAIVTFKQQPVAVYDGHVKGYEKTKTSNGKLNPNSAAAKKYLGYLKTEHSTFAKWLQKTVPSAKITSEYFITLNAVAVKLNGNAIGKLRASTEVESVEYNARYYAAMSESHKIINADAAWAAAGPDGDAGHGVKIAILDTGVDADHPFLAPNAGMTYPAGFPKCDAADSAVRRVDTSCENVSPKVIVSKVFSNKAGLDSTPVADHGTHVAGEAAGKAHTTATIEGVTIPGLSGIAPGAFIGNYKVLTEETPAGTSGRSEDILNGVEAAVRDGMDVLNLSLGGGYHGNNDLLAKGLDNAVDAGAVVVAAAGNEGPGGFTVGSPGRARNIITAGASTNQHFVGQPIHYPADGASIIGGFVSEFPKIPAATYTLFDVAGDGCTSVPAAASGKLAIIDRGTCAFSQKVANAKTAGALGVLIVNNVAGDPVGMARTAGFADDLPAVMVGRDEGAALRASHATTASVPAQFADIVTDNADILASFSSQGPTIVDLAIKPDVTSVGVNVLSSIACNLHPAATCGGEGTWEFLSGTSMATPHLAGSAAVLLDIHPGWTPAMVKSALVNTADLVVKDASSGASDVGPMAQGAGREDLTEAASSTIFLTPVSASFGKISGSQNIPTTLRIHIANTSGGSQAFTLSSNRFTPATGALAPFGAGTIGGADSRITFPASVTVPAGGTDITVAVKAGLPHGSIVQGWITLTGASGPYQLAYWAQVAP